MAQHVVTDHSLHQLLACLGAPLYGDLIDNEFHVLARELPGPAVSAILPPMPDGALRIIYDPNKPAALEHTRRMIREWWASGDVVILGTPAALGITG